MAKKKSTGIDWMGLAKAVIKAATASPTPMHSGGERRGLCFQQDNEFESFTMWVKSEVAFAILPVAKPRKQERRHGEV